MDNLSTGIFALKSGALFLSFARFYTKTLHSFRFTTHDKKMSTELKVLMRSEWLYYKSILT